MYEQYWGLTEKPFDNTPDPRFMYYSKQHEEALAVLLYAIKEEKGAAMLTGEYGSGKTVLSRIIIDELMKNKAYEVALIIYPQLTPTQFMQEIIYQLKNEQAKGSKPQLLHLMQDLFYKNYQEDKKTIILIDEAQIIKSQETLDEIRLILNFQLNNKFLITLLLIGQPELLKKVKSMPQLEQRLGIKYHLAGLNTQETEEYINHRLAVAGATRQIFTREAIQAIYEYSNGLPRMINNICDMSLLIGFGQEAKGIDEQLTQRVALDLNREVSVHAKDV